MRVSCEEFPCRRLWKLLFRHGFNRDCAGERTTGAAGLYLLNMRVSPRRTAIARARIKAGMLQKEFADHCGVSVSHMRKVELGTRKSATIAAKAKALPRQKTQQ